jgi:hypothetical protein
MASTATSKTFVLPQDPLTALNPDEPPNATTIRTLCQELYANAQSVESKLGGGGHGHLGMLMPGPEYITYSINGTPYVPPDKPPVPVYAGTATQREQQRENHRAATEEYDEARFLAHQLRQQLLQAVPRIYIAELANSRVGFANVTPTAILTHLVANYGTITPAELEENLARIKTPWNPDTPIENVFATGKDCRQFAIDGQEPIPDGAYVRILLHIFRQSGVLDDSIRDWDKKPPADQTVQGATAHFTRDNKLRIASKGYLKDILGAHMANAAALPPLPAGQDGREPPPDGTLTGFFYCWSHGITTHQGSTCKHAKKGHVPTATMLNRCGGTVKVNLGRHKDMSYQHPKRKADNRHDNRDKGKDKKA